MNSNEVKFKFCVCFREYSGPLANTTASLQRSSSPSSSSSASLNMCTDIIAIQLQKLFQGLRKRERKPENISPVMIVNDDEKEKMNNKRSKSENMLLAMIDDDEEESSENLCHFELLPLEIQEAILSYLPTEDLFSVAKTSRSLNSVTKTQSLWTKLTLDWRDIYENHKFCQDLIKDRCCNLRSMEITNKIKKDHSRGEFDRKLATIMDLILKAGTLRRLKVDKKIEIGDCLLSKISEMSSLTSVDLTGHSSLSLSPLSNLTNLNSLKLYNMGHIKSEEIDHLFSSMRNLKIVEVPNTTIQDSSIACLVKNNVKLNHLSINYCSLISSEGIMILAKACPNLRHVSMKKCEKLRDVDAIHLLSSCPELRHIGLSRVTDKTLRKICEVCPKMQSVSLEHAWVTEKGVTELLTSAPRIQHLDFIENALLSVANDFDDKFKVKFPSSRVTIKVRKSDYPLKL